MMFSKFCISVSLILALYIHAAAASGSTDIAVYWGQNASEGTLRDTCATGLYAYVNLAFLSTFGGGRAPLLNLAGHCDAASDTCASLAADVASCQSAGVKVLLSIGGAVGGYNLSSASDAQAVATYIWNNFLGGSAADAPPRPLGEAVLDGVDFDIESPSPHYDDLARNLKSLFNGDAAGRRYVLAAAPQCPFPDAALAAALGTGLFDRVWVQFYNNPPCQYAPGDVTNMRTAWEQWTASLPSAAVFLGLPASPDAAGGGFVDAETLVSQVLPVVEAAGNYGGIMLWSRSYDEDSGFSVKLQGILRDLNGQGASLNKKKRIYIIVGVTVVGVLLLLLLVSACFHCHKKYRGVPAPEEGSRTPPKTEPSLPNQRSQHLKRYTYSEVERMTKNFAHELGHGICGDVYTGNLRDGCQVAVKVLKSCKGDDEEFMIQVASISRISHVNVVPLVGFCLEGPTRALIYEYMPNGSLESYALRSNNDSVEVNYSLWLEKLFDIAIGVAQGLEYLHGESSATMVHLNVKPRNILLDQQLCPKISDVGVANLCLDRDSKRSRRSAYDAPEVVSRKFGPVTSKADVYSFGVMVLEMVRAKRNIGIGADTTSKYFAQWLYEHLDQFCDSISDISSEARGLVKKMIIVGLWCIQTAQTNRPSMSRVVEMLESSNVDLELPVRIS